MSSRRSNSVSSRSNTLRAPRWKTSSGLSAQPATSISKIFAQPLQGSPLRSAIDQLPAHAIALQDDSRSTITGDDLSVKHERLTLSEGGEHEYQNTLAADGESRVVSSAVSIVSKAEDSQVDTDAAPLAAAEPRSPAPQAELQPPTQPITISPSPSASTRTPSAPNSQPSSYIRNVPSPPSRSSWFGSLSRSRDRQSSVASTSLVPDPPRLMSPPSTESFENTVHLQQQVGVQLPIPAPPVSPPGNQAAAASTTPSSSPPRTSPNIRTTSSHMTSAPKSAVPSVDDEVPLPKVEVVETDVPVKPAEVVTRKVSASGLNSSTSRFMLRIPLLGRPKTPLEEVIAHPAEEILTARESDTQTVVPEVIVSQPSAESIVSEPEPITNETASQQFVEQANEEPAIETTNDQSSSLVEPTPPNSTDIPQSSSSWWSYVGWSSSTSTAEVNAQQLTTEASASTSVEINAESTPSTAQDPVPDAQIEVSKISDPASPTPEASAHSAGEPPLEASVEEGQKADVTSEPDKQQTPSIFSAETAKSQGSAWYSPWSWYAASPIVPSTSSGFPVSASTLGEQKSESQQEMPSMTESEMVKEEALARDNEADTTPRVPQAQLPSNTTDALGPQPTLDTTPPSPPVNPIESSIASNRSGWALFLMSKALSVRTITDGRESKTQNQGEMEVMNIDEDDDQDVGKAAGGSSSTAITAQPEKEKAARVGTTPPGSKAVAIAPQKPSSIASTTPSASTSPKPQESAKLPLKEREPKKPGPLAPPLTNSDSIKKETAKVKASGSRSPSPAPSKASANSPRASPPNLVLPTWNDTFLSLPRSFVPPPPPPPQAHKGKLSKTFEMFSGVLWHGKDDQPGKGSLKEKEKERERDNPFVQFGMELPKALDVVGQPFDPNTLNEKCRVVVIGVAGWMPGAITRTLAGGLPSSSSKFVDLTCTALENFEEEHGFKFKKITRIPLEGDGTIERKVARNYAHLMGNEEWVDDLHSADVIFVAAHSQGTVVSVHLIDKLIKDGHIMTDRNVETIAQAVSQVAPAGTTLPSTTHTQKICCLALCGVHLGPLRYLRTSSLLQPYIQYFENAAARELFDFQDTESEVSKKYVKALTSVMDHGTKMVCIASLNDQVVPIYSGLFTAASHPRILRALYIDGDAYHSSDFLSNLLVLLIRIMNSGLSDSGLLAHLSEATAGTLSGVGHSSAYEELSSYSLAVNYLFMTTDGTDARQGLVVEPFNAVNEQNDYEIPWSLRDLIADERVAHFFASEFSQLKDAFDHWSPKTTILRDVKRKLQPIQRLSSIKGSSFGSRL